MAIIRVRRPGISIVEFIFVDFFVFYEILIDVYSILISFCSIKNWFGKKLEKKVRKLVEEILIIFWIQKKKRWN